MREDKKTIGIIGGGQLGQMMAISAQYLGHRVLTLDPAADCPASKVSDGLIVAAYDDLSGLTELAERCDVLTYEFENVSAKALSAVASSTSIPQGVELLEITQDRRREKFFLESVGATLAPWRAIAGPDDLPNSVSRKQVVKTATGGYDGHGQVVLSADSDLAAARQLADSYECVLEDFIDFEREISVIVSGNGRDFVTFPIAENAHYRGILHRTIVPARVNPDVAGRARHLALAIADRLHLVGTLCLEMFLTAEGRIYVNELAPRPHNSGHYTIEACDFSQFDLHIRGILGQKLPEPQLLSPAIMINVLGQHLSAVAQLTETHPDWHLHDYGKSISKRDRKMGHITILTRDTETSRAEIATTGIWTAEEARK